MIFKPINQNWNFLSLSLFFYSNPLNHLLVNTCGTNRLLDVWKCYKYTTFELNSFACQRLDLSHLFSEFSITILKLKCRLRSYSNVASRLTYFSKNKDDSKTKSQIILKIIVIFLTLKNVKAILHKVR